MVDNSADIIKREKEYWEKQDEFEWLSVKNVRSIVERIGAPEGRVLELCIGSGMFTRQIDLSKVKEYVGVDLSSRLLQRLKKELPFVRAVEGDAQRLDFPERYFDEIFIFAGLHHLPDIAAALEGCFRVLKDNGRFFCFEPNGSLFYRRLMFAIMRRLSDIYTDDETALSPQETVRLLAQAGFTGIKIEYMMPNYSFFGNNRFFLFPFFLVMKLISFIPINSVKSFFIISCRK